MNAKALRKAYADFVRRHYVRAPLREPAHVRAVLEAAGSRGRPAPEHVWERISPEWVWAVSPVPFSGIASRRANARYRRLCKLDGVRP